MKKVESSGELPQINTEEFFVSPKGYCYKEKAVQSNFENRVVKDTSPQNLSYLRYNKNDAAAPEEAHKEEKLFVEENFGCLLSLFLGLIAFILWCFISGWQ